MFKYLTFKYLIEDLLLAKLLHMQLMHGKLQTVHQELSQWGKQSSDKAEQRTKTDAAGSSHFCSIIKPHYQSESCPGRP